MSNNDRMLCSRESAEKAMEAVIRFKMSGVYFEHQEALLEALVHYDPKAINSIIPHLTFRQCFRLQHLLYWRTRIVNKIAERYPSSYTLRG